MMQAFPRRYRTMAFAAVAFLVFAAALVSVGANYGLPESPAIADVEYTPNLNLTKVPPVIPLRSRTEISPNKVSHFYAIFPGSYWEYPLYRGAAYYPAVPVAAPNLSVEVPSLDVQSLLPANTATSLGDALKSAPVTVQDTGRKVGDTITQGSPELPKQLPVTIRPPGGDVGNALNSVVPSVPNVPSVAPGLLRR